jgi:predicted dehydrogenase
MESRRAILKLAAAGAVAGARSVVGANDRVQVGVIGTGTRAMRDHTCFLANKDVVFVAACEVDSTRLANALKRTGKLDTYGDYRKVLDRKDVDAVLIATPDHWHSQMVIDAIAAGKDIYCEKPVSNTVERAQKMLDAVQKSRQIVEVGMQQRSWDYFQEAYKTVQSGILGKISHVTVQFPGGYSNTPDPQIAVPDGLDWESWQGPAPRHPYQVSRQRRWRAYYDYGGGLVTDWGVHLIDIAHWFMNADNKGPLRTVAASQYVNFKDPAFAQLPDAFSVAWQYDDFVMTFANCEYDTPEIESWGTYFHGSAGSLQVNRQGWRMTPNIPRRVNMPATAIANPNAQRERPPAFEGKVHFNPNGGVEVDYPAIAHVRNFLDCVKSRQKPTCDMNIGFHSSLPCLLGVMAIQQQKTILWDGRTATAV